METTAEEGIDITANQSVATNADNNKDNNKDNKEDNDEDNNEDNNKDKEDNDEDNNEDNNKDNNKDNDEENDDLDESEDIFTLMYGRDEEFDDESDNEDNVSIEVNNGLNADIKNSIEKNHNKRSSDSVNTCSKRRSDESDCLQNKRIKSESFEVSTTKRLTTTIEAVVSDEPPPPDIPTNSYEFMSYLLDLNANDLETNDSNRFSMSRSLQNIRQTLRFSDLNDFRNAFIPYVLTDLWRKLNHHNNQNHKNIINVMNLKHFLSILTKVKSNKMKNGLEMKCISVVRHKEGPVFQFGQLITIQTAVQPKPNSTTHIITRRRYFGYITSHSIRGTNVDNQSEVNHLRLLNESKRESVIVEEINFMTKYSDELYLRNDALIVAEPIVCIHDSYLEARTVFKFDDFPIWKQIFDPIFSTKPSGLTVTVNERKFNRTQVEMIQIGLDVIANNSFSNSCFLAINGSKDSPKTPILMEMIRQIVMCKGLGTTKVLFCGSDSNTLRNADQILKSRKIKTFFVETDIENSLKEFAIKHIEHKLSKDLEPQQKHLYEQCLQYFDCHRGEGPDLSVECLVFKNIILDKLRIELMATCSVIVGRIDHLCNDILFYKYFTQPNNCITCCVIDDSMSITETQLYSLFWFGIKKFLLGGDISLSNDNGTDICRAYGLSRSFFERYYYLYLENNDSNQSAVFNV